MRRSRHRPLLSGRFSFSLLSVLALIAFVCLPALAQAEECTDSSCKQYEVEIPTAGGEQKSKKPKTSHAGEPTAEASESPPVKQNKTPSSGGSQEEPEEEQGGATPGGNGGNGDGSSGKGGNSPGSSGSNQSSTGIGDSQSLGSTTQGQNASHSDGGGSSPLVPILIAIAVLAAISIGAVIYRQRRQGSGGSGSPVSPNA